MAYHRIHVDYSKVQSINILRRGNEGQISSSRSNLRFSAIDGVHWAIGSTRLLTLVVGWWWWWYIYKPTVVMMLLNWFSGSRE